MIDILFFKLRSYQTRLSIWWYWYSPPWKWTRRCPECAGNKGKDKRGVWFECDMCDGSGKVSKSNLRRNNG